MRRSFSWIALGGALLLILDGCQVGTWSTPAQEQRIFLRNLQSSLDNRDSTLWVTRPDVYGADVRRDRMRGPSRPR